MIIGARIIKTGIAVTITMYICQLLNLEPALFGAVSAVINMQPSIYLTLKTARDQVLVHVMGVAAGLGLGYLLGGNPLSMGITTVLIITFYKKLKLQNGILMGIVAAIFILGSSPEQFLSHAFTRSSVIFIGLTTAMVVNVILWPPRYGRRFMEKLRESNAAAVGLFCRAVHDFAGLEDQAIPAAQDISGNATKLQKETRILAEHFRREKNSDNLDSAPRDEWLQTVEKFMDYNESLTEKAGRIYELIPARLERRVKSGTPLVSSEFRAILDILESGCPTVDRVNGKLRALLCDGVDVEPEEITETYWEKLTAAIEQWQPRLTDSYYLHALLEVAVVANEIRWAAREGKKLLKPEQGDF
jgi:uncharacterized membrane protein YgaE (UPF0421/DUF939 family)